MMRFYTTAHRFYCGIDLHARTMHVCVLAHDGEVVLDRKLPCHFETLLRALAPFRDGIVVGVECMFGWYWLADRCAEHNIPFVVGHALYMKLIHGGMAKNDRIDANKIAHLLRGGNFPLAYAYPKGMRETRDLLRRRMYLVHKRAELITHLEILNAQNNLPPFGKKLSYAANRAELNIPERFRDASVQMSATLDLDVMDKLDELIAKVEPLDFFRQPVVTRPEAWRSPVIHRSVQRPSRKSRRASSTSQSRRPADTSASNCRSHCSASNSANQARKVANSSEESWRTPFSSC
jgi:hypothetical protein